WCSRPASRPGRCTGRPRGTSAGGRRRDPGSREEVSSPRWYAPGRASAPRPRGGRPAAAVPPMLACPAVKTSLGKETLGELAARLAPGNLETARRYPLDTGRRQPVHTVYGGAHLFKADLAAKLGKVAVRILDEYGAEPG